MPAPVIASSDMEARRRAAVVFEVLGGLRTPSDAARELGMTLPRYYALEKRALEGAVAACAVPRRKGRQRSPAKEMDHLRAQVSRLERESSRNLAMARAMRRTAGLSAPSPAVKAKAAPQGKNVLSDADKDDGKKRRKRRPSARALAVAHALRGGASAESASSPATEAPPGAGIVLSVPAPPEAAASS